MRKLKRKFLSLFLAALTLCPTALPASAAESATAATMQLKKTEGAVSVTNATGRDLTVRNNMRLYNGYHAETQAASYAWINLDDTKLAKLDAVSKVEVRSSGKKLELLLKSGDIFFNVTSPLEADETLNVRTSTMVVGIRGTCGIIRVIDRWATEIYVLEGTVQCSATDPVTGQIKTETLQSGDKAIATAYPQDQEGDKCDIILDRFEVDDIGGFVLVELAGDPGLCGDIYEASGMDILDSVGLLEHIRRELEDIRSEMDGIRELFERGELSAEETQARLDELRQQLEDLRDQLERAAPDDNARRRLDQAREHLQQAQEALDNARSRESLDRLNDAREDLEGSRRRQADDARRQGEETARGRLEQDKQEMQGKLDDIDEQVAEQEHDISDAPVWEPEPPASDTSGGGSSGGGSPTTVSYKMPLTDKQVQGYLDENGIEEVILLPGDNPADNTLLVSTADGTDALTVENGKTLTLSTGIDVEVQSGNTLTVNGTLSGTGALTNYGTLTVDSGKTLRMQSIENEGVLTNTANGRIVANDILISADATSSGIIEGGVTVKNGTFTMNGGTIDGGSDGAVILAVGAAFVMNGGEVASSDDWATISSDGTLTLAGGTVTNSGTGYAVSVPSADAVTVDNDNTLIRAARKDFFFITDSAGLTPGANAPRYENGYYYAVAAEDFGDCGADGADVMWDLIGGVLTVSGTGNMEDYATGDAPWCLYNRRDITTVRIAGGVTSIGEGAFYYCDSLTSVTIPDSVAEIGSFVFFYCDSLPSVTIPEGVTSIGEGAFYFCRSLTSVTIPKGVRSIGANAFYNCDNLTSVTIPDSVRSIGERAFYFCGGLTSVTIPEGVTSIAERTFQGCISLTSVTIPEGVTSIGEGAFRSCTSLVSVTIPASVAEIGDSAFNGCDGLTTVYYGGSADQWNQIAIDVFNENLTEADIKYNSSGPETGYGLTEKRAVVLSAAAASPFADVPEGAWYADAVQYVYENGLMTGAGGGVFSPDSAASRGTLVTILHRLEGPPAAASAAFPDVPEGEWYSDAVAWASANGIVTGYDNGNFGPNDPLKREQMAAILYRYAGYKGYDTLAFGDVSVFPDGDTVSAYALEAMRWAVGAGLIQGSDGLLSPTGGATRAQSATVLTRFCEDVARSYALAVVSAMDVMCEPSGIFFLEDGSFLVTDTYNKVIWRVDGDSSTVYLGPSSVYAGGDTVTDPFDRPIGGYNDASLEDSYFKLPWAIVPFLDGYAVSDADNNVVRLVRSETIHTVNGSTKENLTVTELGVALDHPTGLASDEAGNLYVSDTFAGAVRKITPKGVVTTFVKGLTDPMGLCWKDGTLYIAEAGANRIVSTTGGKITAVAGSGEDDFIDGLADEAAFSAPQGVTVGDDGTIYVSDTINGAVRRIKNGAVATLASRDESDLDTFIPTSPVGLMLRGDQLYVCDSFARKIFVISLE